MKGLEGGVRGIDKRHVVSSNGLGHDCKGNVIVPQLAGPVGAGHEAESVQCCLELGGGADEHVHFGSVLSVAEDGVLFQDQAFLQWE